MTFLQKIRFFHNEWVKQQKEGRNVDENFRVTLCERCGLQVQKKGSHGADQKPNIKPFDNFFQLAFRDGEIWEMQEHIFNLWEQGKLKGQKMLKAPSISRGGKAKADEAIKPLLIDMKITSWRSMQGIRDTSLINHILARVKAENISLEEMGAEFERYISIVFYHFHSTTCF